MSRVVLHSVQGHSVVVIHRCGWMDHYGLYELLQLSQPCISGLNKYSYYGYSRHAAVAVAADFAAACRHQP